MIRTEDLDWEHVRHDQGQHSPTKAGRASRHTLCHESRATMGSSVLAGCGKMLDEKLRIVVGDGFADGAGKILPNAVALAVCGTHGR